MRYKILIQFCVFVMFGIMTCTTTAQQTIVYKQLDTATLSMEVFLPTPYDTTQTYPAVVFFFGGGWVNRNLDQFVPQAQYFAQRGAICFIADYRVRSDEGATPFEALKDAKSAIRYLRANAAEWHIDTARIVAAGGSAGGHLAAATALVKEFNEASDDLSVSCIPNALVLFNPVIDNGPGGYGYKRVKDRYKDFSPLHNIKAGNPPTIIFLGTMDHLIPVETAQYYQKASERAGNRCELRLYDNQKHGFFNHRNPKYYQLTVEETDQFLTSLGILDVK